MVIVILLVFKLLEVQLLEARQTKSSLALVLLRLFNWNGIRALIVLNWRTDFVRAFDLPLSRLDMVRILSAFRFIFLRILTDARCTRLVD